jgi:hypothetical protein
MYVAIQTRSQWSIPEAMMVDLWRLRRRKRRKRRWRDVDERGVNFSY